MTKENYTSKANIELVDEISKINVPIRNLTRYLKKNNIGLFSEIVNRTEFLDNGAYKGKTVPILYRLYCLEHNLTSSPTCSHPNCNNPVEWDCTRRLPSAFCCRECNNSDPNMASRVKQAILNKYGVENVFQLEEIKGKIKQTMISKYGVEHALQFDEFKNKARQSCIERFGVEYPSSLPEIQQQMNETKIEKYGDPHFNNREKAEQTCLERYGVRNATVLDSTKEKMSNTCIERYGVEHYSKTDAFKDKFKNTSSEHYGVEHPMQSDAIKSKISKISIETIWNKLNSSSRTVIPLFSKDDCANISSNKIYKWKCKICGNEFESEMSGNWWKVSQHSDYARCLVCHPLINKGFSDTEREIVDFIQSIYSGKFTTNDSTIIYPYELDIYIPERRLAFEYDGLYWHCEERGKDKIYHLKKTNECKDKNIQLIHIFENEWLDKQDIVKSRIENLLGIFNATIYARNCKVKEVESKLSFEFQEKNHLQGGVNSKVNLGLYYEDELVSLMTFSKPRFSKKYEWELVRFCNKCGYHIPGGASKLLKHFERTYHPRSIVSYADRRWSIGHLYDMIGFELIGASSPNYWYFNDKRKLESRIKYQKHKLSGILDKFDNTKSEVSNMYANGYHRIFDCGNLIFSKKYDC